MIQCPICKKYFKHINNMHLKKHNLTTEQFKSLYPNYNTCSKEFSEKRSAANKIQMLKIHKKNPKERYVNVGIGRKKAWDNCSEERRKEIGLKATECWRKYDLNEENKRKKYKKVSKSLKKYYKNLDPKEKEKILKNSLFKIRKHGGAKIETNINGKIIKFRSIPEIWIAEFLEQSGFSWEYETLKIDYLDKNNNMHIYIPDFYIKDYNLVLEFKGKNFLEEDIEIYKKYYTEKAGFNYILLMYQEKYLLLKELKKIFNL